MFKPFTRLLAGTALGLALVTQGCAPASDDKTITIGTTVGDFTDMATDSIKPMLEQQGYTVKVVEFTDYIQPNVALAEGALDVNVFQHKPYLDDFIRERNLPLAPVFQVPTAPLGLYSGKLKRLEDAKSGSTVAVPNDSTNQARALVMLEKLGWLSLKPGINTLTASERDVATNPKGIKLLPLEAAQLPRAREDADFAVINGNYATSSGIQLTEALFQEPGYTYVNVGVMRRADVEKPWAKDVIAAYNSPAFRQWAEGKYKGYKMPESWR